jgi:hypothetical protein
MAAKILRWAVRFGKFVHPCHSDKPVLKAGLGSYGRFTIIFFMKWLCEWLQAWFYPSNSRGPSPRGSLITTRHTTFGRTPLDVWSARFSLTTRKQNAPVGIRISLSLQVSAVDPRLRSCGHWNRQIQSFAFKIKFDYLLVNVKGCLTFWLRNFFF